MITSTNRTGKSLLLTGVLSLLVAASLPAAAASFTVTSTGDTPDADLADGVCADAQGACSLRAAVMQANALGGTNTIDLSLINDPNNPIILSIPGADETYTGNATDGFVVTSAHDASKGDLNITSSMSIVGAGSGNTIIEWDPSVKQDPAKGDRVFHIEAVSSNIDVSISGVTIQNGVTPLEKLPPETNGTYYQFERWGGGLAIGPSAAMTLIDPSKSGSDSGSGGDTGGGGEGGSEGGESSAVVNSVTLTDVRVLDNQSGTAGGGIASAAPLTLNNVLVSGNTATTNGGGIYNDAQLTIVNSTIGTMTGFANPNSAEGGGGIFDTGMHSTLIDASSIVGNKATGGGGISARSLVTMTITSSTIAKNEATDVGAGITTNGSVTLKNDTIADNAAANDSTSGGAGLNAFGSGAYNFVNTAFQHNLSTAASANCGCSGSSCKARVMVSQGHNIADDSTCAFNPLLADIPNTNAQLQALAGNGGPTETMALLMNTPAVDAGDNAYCPNTDQRGNMRPADGNLNGKMQCDIGAFELFTPSNDLHVSGQKVWSGNQAQNQVRHGQPANVSFEFTNDVNASADATGVTITTDPLPAAYEWAGSTVTVAGTTNNCPFDTQSRVVTCDVGTLARGQTATLELHGAAGAAGTMEVTAHVSATAPADPFPDNNTSTVTINVQGNSNLAITATAPNTVTVNTQAAVTVTVKNIGPDIANNVEIDGFAEMNGQRLALQELSGQSGNCGIKKDVYGNDIGYCKLGSIASGASLTGTLMLQPTVAGTATVTLNVSTTEYDEDNSNDTAVVTVLAETPSTPTTPTSSSGGGGGCVSKPGGPFDPALLALVLAGAAGMVSRRWRKASKESGR